MQRPVMDLQYMREVEEAAQQRPPIDWGRFVRPLLATARVAGRVAVTLLATSLRRRPESPTVHRVVRGVLYRLMFLPILLSLGASALVYFATHPRPQAAPVDPISVGVYYDPVTIVAADGVRSDAWLAPAIDARQIIADREKALRTRSPGVVLVHDMGKSQRQMLPLVKPLHEAGFVVLVVGVRGSGTADAVGQTFGINETLDVRAAVDMLRRRPYVDPQRMAVIGVGSGATAAVLAREQDPTITGLVLVDLPADASVPVNKALRADSPVVGWAAPIFQWTFEVAYQANLSDLDVRDTLDRLDPNAVLHLQGLLADDTANRSERVQPVTEFLVRLFGKPGPTRTVLTLQR